MPEVVVRGFGVSSSSVFASRGSVHGTLKWVRCSFGFAGILRLGSTSQGGRLLLGPLAIALFGGVIPKCSVPTDILAQEARPETESSLN